MDREEFIKKFITQSSSCPIEYSNRIIKMYGIGFCEYFLFDFILNDKDLRKEFILKKYQEYKIEIRDQKINDILNDK